MINIMNPQPLLVGGIRVNWQTILTPGVIGQSKAGNLYGYRRLNNAAGSPVGSLLDTTVDPLANAFVNGIVGGTASAITLSGNRAKTFFKAFVFGDQICYTSETTGFNYANSETTWGWNVAPNMFFVPSTPIRIGFIL